MSAIAAVMFVASNTLPVAFVAFNPRFLMLKSSSVTVNKSPVPVYTILSIVLFNPITALPELTVIAVAVLIVPLIT